MFKHNIVIPTGGRNHTHESTKRIANLCRVCSVISPSGRNDKTFAILNLCQRFICYGITIKNNFDLKIFLDFSLFISLFAVSKIQI